MLDGQATEEVEARDAPPLAASHPGELLASLIDEFNDSVSVAHYESGLWAILIIVGGRLHVFDSEKNPYGVFQLKPNATLPGDGYYLSAYITSSEGSGWRTRRFRSTPGGDAWMPWGFSGKDSKSTVFLEDWISTSDRG